MRELEDAITLLLNVVVVTTVAVIDQTVFDSIIAVQVLVANLISPFNFTGD